MKLTPEQFRFFVLATAWSVTNRTDGEIETTDLLLIPSASDPLAEALVSAGLWVTTKQGWVICDFNTTQTSSAQLERIEETRRRDRERKAKERKTRPEDPLEVQADVQTDRPADVVVENQGKARTGKERKGFGQPEMQEPVEPDFWNSGFPHCSVEGCSVQLLHESQWERGLCSQH